jgi:hypothetical protein
LVNSEFQGAALLVVGVVIFGGFDIEVKSY